MMSIPPDEAIVAALVLVFGAVMAIWLIEYWK